VTAAEQLPEIPADVRCMGDKRSFVRVPACSDEWLVLGPAAALLVGHEVPVRQHSTGDVAYVRVKRHIAERVVQHRRGSYSFQTQGPSTRWVLAEIVQVPR
jgi:hypothetical protein